MNRGRGLIAIGCGQRLRRALAHTICDAARRRAQGAGIEAL